MNDWLEPALDAARDASALLNDRFTRLLEVENKGSFDMVTEADRACEKLIV
jgi:fructose-1,6-bisphosphatase/inositol monophosphatase family enzyme